jgi:PEP-CTERM motif-containing protein
MKNIIAVLVLLLAPSFAHAVLVNGNFEVGLAGWSIMGDVLTVDSSFGVDTPQGHLQVLMTSAPDTAPYPPNGIGVPEHIQSYSGTNSVSGFSSVFLFFDSPFVFGHPLGVGIFEWSGIKQTFIANTDILLSFTWKCLTDEGTLEFGTVCEDSPGFEKPFYVIDGVANILNPSGAASVSPTPFRFESRYETTTLLLAAGTHTIGFGVGDVADTWFNTGLLVDDISFRAVPEPATWLLFGIGLIVLAAVIKFRRSHR